jgi:hypothetical protein
MKAYILGSVVFGFLGLAAFFGGLAGDVDNTGRVYWSELVVGILLIAMSIFCIVNARKVKNKRKS